MTQPAQLLLHKDAQCRARLRLAQSLSCGAKREHLAKTWEGEAALAHTPRQAPASGLIQPEGRGPTTRRHPPMPTCHGRGPGAEPGAGRERSRRSGPGVDRGGR